MGFISTEQLKALAEPLCKSGCDVVRPNMITTEQPPEKDFSSGAFYFSF